MIEVTKFQQRVGALEKQLHSKLGVRGRSLEKRFARAGRLLPKHVRRSGQVITRAQAALPNPRLARLHDQKAIERAFADVNCYLNGVDPAERRKDAVLGVLGSMVFNLLLLGAALAGLLYWQGVI